MEEKNEEIVETTEVTNTSKNKKNSNIVYIIIIALLIIGFGLYICYDKGIIFKKDTDSKKSSENSKEKENKEEKTDDNKNDDSKDKKEEKKNYPTEKSSVVNTSGGTGFDEYTYKIGNYTFIATEVYEDDYISYEITNKDGKDIATFNGSHPDGATFAFNSDGSVSYLDSYNKNNECYTYKRFSYDGKEIKTTECVETIVDNYLLLKENNHIKLKTYDGNYVKDFDFNLSKGNYTFHSMLSGWFTDEGKKGIYLVIENNDIEYGELGAGLEYYFEPSTGEVGTIKTEGVGGYAKPVLYLYPEKETKVSVNFENPNLLTTTYPKFENSWNVTAKPNGDLFDSNGKYYYGLYWEEKGSTNVDFTEGFYVTKDNAIRFLEEKLNFIGLNDKERNEFIMYWLPILEKNGKSVVYFELTEERNVFNKLIINPTPDSLLRVAIHVKKVSSKPSNLKEEKLAKFNRSGFAAIEWGGVIH